MKSAGTSKYRTTKNKCQHIDCTQHQCSV